MNVISWNDWSTNLIASGSDDGSFKIWDLRYYNRDPITTVAYHREQITGIQWCPQDEWSLAVASADNSVTIWDFSVEKDDEAELV